MDLEDLAVLLVPVIAYLLTWLSGYVLRSLPKVVIPILASALGPVADMLSSWLLTDTGLPGYVTILIGGAAVWLNELIVQLRKQFEASTGLGRLVKPKQETGIRWRRFR